MSGTHLLASVCATEAQNEARPTSTASLVALCTAPYPASARPTMTGSWSEARQGPAAVSGWGLAS